MDDEWHLVTRQAKKTRKPSQQQQQQLPAVVKTEQVMNIMPDDNKNLDRAMKKSPSKEKVVVNDKLDHENEGLKYKKMLFSSGNLLQQARKAKGYSQKEFATIINERPQVVQDYETGYGIINNHIIEKMEKVLLIKLIGADRGKPLNFK